MSFNPLKKLLVLLVGMLTLGACGYSLKGRADALSGRYSTIAIIPAENKTFEPDLGPLLDAALAEEFSRSGRLRVVKKGESDLVLELDLVSYSNSASSYSSSDQARDYRISIKADARLTESNGGELIWKGRGLGERKDYSVTPGDISAAESSRSEAKAELLRDLAELVHDYVFEGF